MRIQDTPESLRFSHVRRRPRSEWPNNWLKGGSEPGDIMLLEGDWGKIGGILCLTKTGRYMALTVAQVFEGAEIEWPEPGAAFSIHLIGDAVQLKVKEEPEGPS